MFLWLKNVVEYLFRRRPLGYYQTVHNGER